MNVLLVVAVFLPLAGAIVVAGGRRAARWMALVVTLVTFALTCVLVAQFPIGREAFVVDWPWLSPASIGLDIRFSLGLDGLSLWLFALSALLLIPSVLVSWEAITEQPTLYYRLLLILETGLLGVFAARDIILFYIFFECTLIPLFFLIGVWGSEERRHAAIKFFLFTLAGSLLTFLGLLCVVLWVYWQDTAGGLTFSIPQLTERLQAAPMPLTVQLWVFGALFAGFAIKVPLFPFHTWLPLAHVQAPTAGSVLLAGVLLKIGTYGFVRFNLPMLPEATAVLAPALLWISVVGILYGALVALAQRDMKRLIAYSSVSHLGYCMLGVFVGSSVAMQGGVLQMVNHGLSTGGLFAVVGMIYERYHTRQIAELGGIAARTPLLAFFMLVMTLASIGLPGLNGFVGEFLVLLGTFQRAWSMPAGSQRAEWLCLAVLACLGVLLGAWYMLQLVRRVFFGPLREPAGHGTQSGHAAGHGLAGDLGHGQADPPLPPSDVRDLSLREVAALAPLAAVCLWIGLAPQFFLERIEPAVRAVRSQESEVRSELRTPHAPREVRDGCGRSPDRATSADRRSPIRSGDPVTTAPIVAASFGETCLPSAEGAA